MRKLKYVMFAVILAVTPVTLMGCNSMENTVNKAIEDSINESLGITGTLEDFNLKYDEEEINVKKLYGDLTFGERAEAVYEVTLKDDTKFTADDWQELPLTKNAKVFMENLSDDAKEKLPELKQGYYKFMDDRNDEASSDGEGMLAVYNKESKKLYVIIYES